MELKHPLPCPPYADVVRHAARLESERKEDHARTIEKLRQEGRDLNFIPTLHESMARTHPPLAEVKLREWWDSLPPEEQAYWSEEYAKMDVAS